MSDPVENLEDVLMLGVIVAVIVGLGFGAEQIYAFFHKDEAAKTPIVPKNNAPSATSPFDPFTTASNVFLWRPAIASKSNSFWQWVSYLFNVPEGSPTLDTPAQPQAQAQYTDAAQNPITTLDAPADGSWGTGGDLWNTGKL